MVSLNKLMKLTNLNIWKQYFIFNLIKEFYYCLSEEIEQEYFNFYNKVLKGTKTMKSQWERTIEYLNSVVGELIGLEYASRFFKPEAKLLAEEIVYLIKTELEDYLKTNDWMEPATKTKALEKLSLMGTKIGYPNLVKKNYAELNISEANPVIENIINGRIFTNKYYLMALYEPLDRSLWFMNAHSVNAYYSPNLNEIVFPAGILQEPFFSPNQDIAYNFGGFGMIIGHEITHGFDDEGSKYDAYGNLNNWWTPTDFNHYKQKTQQIINQYNKYQIDGQNVNGELTLGENIADIGGLALSFRAFKKYVQCQQNKNKIKINYTMLSNQTNLTDEQKFFVNFANIWKSKGRTEDVHQRILLDVHSPPIFRVNGSVRNINEFYQAFNIKLTDKLYLKPEERVKIWG
jgi:putative endopeptidase